MPISLLALIGLVVFASAVAFYVGAIMRDRRTVLTRADGRISHEQVPIAILRQPEKNTASRVASWLKERTPASWSEAGEASSVLVHAGFDGPMAPLFFTTIRLATVVLLPLTGLLLAPKDKPSLVLASVAIGIFAGLILPRAVLDNLAEKRRVRLRKSLPDCLDLLVVCVEAGISLDAAMLRVARDMEMTHPELAGELLVVNRRMGAGLTRDEAVNGLWTRTGLEDLRGLVAAIIQSERLGTSIARVLRVYSETLRRKRRQTAEKKAKEAALKMIIPLGIFMLPAMFAVILGPAMLRAIEVFRSVSGR